MLLVAPGGAAPLFRSFLGAIEGVVGTPYDLRLAAGAFEPEASTLEHAVQSLESFVRESMSMPVHLVGHSGGGAVALAFAAAHPRLLASLTASEPPWVGSSEAGNIGFLDDLRRVVELPTDEVSGAFARLYAASDDVVAELPPFDDAQVRILRAVAIEYQRAHLDLDKLQEVDVPVLLPYGSHSSNHMAVTATWLAGQFKRARVLQIPGANHFDLWVLGAAQLAEAWMAMSSPPTEAAEQARGR